MVKRRSKIKNAGKADRHLGVVLEHVDSKMDLLIEGYHGFDKKIDTLHGEMNERFNEVDYKFSVVFDELHLIRSELKEKVSRDEFVLLEKRVLKLEKGLYARK